MFKINMRWPFYMSSFFACAILSLQTGCASGGFQVTRSYSRWLNTNGVILRVILYILTSVVFVVTLTLDAVIFNTIDFWKGQISKGDFEFKEGGKTYFVHHEIQEGTQLRKSTISFIENGQNKIITIAENQQGEIELFIDGHLSAQVRDLHSSPVATFFTADGRIEKIVSNMTLPLIAGK